jgi:hypothetical protein
LLLKAKDKIRQWQFKLFQIWWVMIYEYALKRDLGYPANQSKNQKHRKESSQNNKKFNEFGQNTFRLKLKPFSADYIG